MTMSVTPDATAGSPDPPPKKDAMTMFADWMAVEEPTNPKRLNKELRRYYVKDGVLGPWLNAPLVQQLPFVSWKWANDMHDYKKARQDEYLKEGRVKSALWLFERPYRFEMIIEWVAGDIITREMLPDILEDFWTDTEHPQQYGYVNLKTLFKLAGFVTDGPPQPTEPVTVYRGCQQQDRLGLSWTTDYDRAQWFATRLGFNGDVFECTVPPEKVLARFDGRGESEYVCDVAGLEVKHAVRA